MGLGSIELFDDAALHMNPMFSGDELTLLHVDFNSSVAAVDGVYDGATSPLDKIVALFTGTEDEALLQGIRPTLMEQAEIMLEGVIDGDGNHTLGLSELSGWKRSTEYWEQNTKQQAGYAAEIISTAKENVASAIEDSGLTTYRADDRPDLGFSKNDQYVDKVRVNAAGEVVERIQTKFVGNNGTDWVKRMMSGKFEKYLDGTKVDKIECPSDYYDEAKMYIAQRKESLGRQLKRVTEDGKADVADSIQSKIEKLNRLDEMVEKSTVSTDEARYARNHPKRYTAKLFATETIRAAAKEGAYGVATTAGLTFVTSSVIHGTEFLDGEISADEMAKEVASEVGVAGAVGGASSFVSAAVASTMQTSSCNLIRSIGGSCLPASAVAFAVESYDSVVDYAQGAIGADELAYDLGHNATTIAGGAVGGGKVGAAAGAAFGPAGAAAGGLIGGLVGSAVASGAYETALQYAPEAAQGIAEQAEAYAKEAMDAIASEHPDQVESAKATFNDFFASNNMPVRI